MNNSDDSSSDSSIDDHFESPDTINFNSSFFNSNKQKLNVNDKTNNPSNNDEQELNSDNSDDDDDDFISEENISSTALLAEVMKNLEKINNNAVINNSSNAESPTPSTSRQLSSPLKNKTLNKNDLLSNEINDLLLKGESALGSSSFQLSNNDDDDIDDDNDVNKTNDTSNYSIPKEGVNITLPGTSLIFNRRQKRCRVDLIEELRKKLNRRLRSNQIYIHKVGILCWLAHGFHLNKQLNHPEILSVVLSLIPQKICPKGRVDLKYLEQFTKWFKSFIKIETINVNKHKKKLNDENNFSIEITKDLLIKRLMDKKVDNYRELILLYISALRAIGINCRLIISLYPPDLKPKHSDLFHAQTSKKDEEEKVDEDEKNDEKKKKRKITINDVNVNKKKLKAKKNFENDEDDDDELKPMKIIPKNSKKAATIAAEEAKKRAAEIIRLKYTNKNDGKKKFDHSVEKKAANDNKEKKSPVEVRQLRSRVVLNKTTNKDTKKNIKAESLNVKDISEDEDDASDDDKNKKIKKGRKVGGKNVKDQATKILSHSKHKKSDNDKIDRRVLSPIEEIDNENKNNIQSHGYYYIWVEVYVESEENWICVSVPDEKIHCVAEIYKTLPSPVLYIIAFNSLGKIKDVTRRYCSNWLTATRKQRIDEKWLNQTLTPWKESQTAMSKAEDESLAQSEMEQPLPKSISECKGHPLYALARHLLKFEALYPPECLPLGHLKNGEAIYSRHCVHTLRSRETWLRQARVVKPAQEPYKTVKSMPKYDKLSGQMIKNQPLELFGEWQTMAYIPPEAKNGKVPRNEYGNVDLFKKCMLPKGTVHIDLPGLFRVAKKLNIDCVGAVVGFNFGGRGAMPMTQGYVVCEEFEDELREAWEEEQVKAIERAKEKRDKRIWGNWRKLIRGLLIREKIIAKYDMAQENDDDDDDDDDDNKADNKSTKRVKKIVSKVIKKKKI